jgi:translation initiation factor 2B subunit (eIF-2B alpha/beta/delta family)
MTSKHEARAIRYKFHQLYRFSTCTVIISADPTHLKPPPGTSFITNPHSILQDNSNSQTYESKVYLRMELIPHENVRDIMIIELTFNTKSLFEIFL